MILNQVLITYSGRKFDDGNAFMLSLEYLNKQTDTPLISPAFFISELYPDAVGVAALPIPSVATLTPAFTVSNVSLNFVSIAHFSC